MVAPKCSLVMPLLIYILETVFKPTLLHLPKLSVTQYVMSLPRGISEPNCYHP